MANISSITRCKVVGGNADGRDLVVSDLHGQRSLLEAALTRLGFDPARDRVFSVGDLVDRGPDSLGTLALVEEPWFHPVLGNHELMLLDYLGYCDSPIHGGRQYPACGDEWIVAALARHRKQLHRLADRLACLPLAIHVDSAIPFNVLHGDLVPFGSTQATLFGEETVCLQDADRSTTSRANHQEALAAPRCSLPFADGSVRISETPFSELLLTYVGHSPVRDITVHRSYVYIDQRGGGRAPAIVDHDRFARWLQGVATARWPAAVPVAPVRRRTTSLEWRRATWGGIDEACATVVN